MNGLGVAYPRADFELIERHVVPASGPPNVAPMFWLPQTYEDLQVVVYGRTKGVGTTYDYVQCLAHFNDPLYYPGTSALTDCESSQIRAYATSADGRHSGPVGDYDIIVGGLPGSDATANQAGYCEFILPAYRRFGYKRTLLSKSNLVQVEAGSHPLIMGGGVWQNDSPLYHLSMYTDGGGFAPGTVFSLYGRG